MTKWEYVSVPVIVHSVKEILDLWGEQGYELVQMMDPGTGLTAFMKRPKSE
jgi:hypothetical protein